MCPYMQIISFAYAYNCVYINPEEFKYIFFFLMHVFIHMHTYIFILFNEVQSLLLLLNFWWGQGDNVFSRPLLSLYDYSGWKW